MGPRYRFLNMKKDDRGKYSKNLCLSTARLGGSKRWR